jgi:hypothetical protein
LLEKSPTVTFVNMSEPSKPHPDGGHLNRTYLLLGSIASLIAIATGAIALHEKMSEPSGGQTGATQPPTIQVQIPALPSPSSQSSLQSPPSLPPPPFPLPGPPGKGDGGGQ